MSQIVKLDPKTATWEAIASVVEGTVNTPYQVQVGPKKLIVERVCTFAHNVLRTGYVHIKIVNTHAPESTVLEHYRENKVGVFTRLFCLPPKLYRNALTNA